MALQESSADPSLEPSESPAVPSLEPVGALLWLRNDLRLLDQPLLTIASSSRALFVYVFDLRFLSKNVKLPGNLGVVKKASARRALFLLQSVRAFSSKIRSLYGTDLIVRIGPPGEHIANVADQLKCQTWILHCQRELGTEEECVEKEVEHAVKLHGGRVVSAWGQQFLYNPDDVISAWGTNPRESLVNPHHFWAEGADPSERVPIRKTIPILSSEDARFLSGLPAQFLDPSGVLRLPDREALVLLGYSDQEASIACAHEPRSVLAFQGGEDAGLERLREWVKDGLAGYFDDRSGVLGANYSSKLSPWLAFGCVSPGTVYWHVHASALDDSRKWFISELGWRDLFRYHLMFHGERVFQLRGPAQHHVPWSHDAKVFRAWCDGKTGLPIVDAHMRELAASGFMSNTGRQLVAAFLAGCLRIDWRAGAMWFEANLLDHDVAINYGNWNREAKVRWAGRSEHRDVSTAAAEEHAHLVARFSAGARGGTGCYDTAAFVKRWVPELSLTSQRDLVSGPLLVYKVLCDACFALDRNARLSDGALRCASCRGACLWCGEVGSGSNLARKRKREYCQACIDAWGASP